MILVAVGVVAARRLAEAEAVNDAAKMADLLADTVVQPALTDGLLTGDAAAFAAMDDVVEHVLGASIVRVKIWDPHGPDRLLRRAGADRPALPARRGRAGGLRQHPPTRADISDLRRRRTASSAAAASCWRSTGRCGRRPAAPLLFETYFRYDDVTERSAQLWRGFAGVTLSSLLLLLVLMMPVLWRLLDRLSRAQAQREALLQRALDASDRGAPADRRRAARRGRPGSGRDVVHGRRGGRAGQRRRARPRWPTTCAAPAATVRTSIGGLRSLLVDIYPASLASAGLAAALDDLAASCGRGGSTVTLDVPPRTSGWTRPASGWSSGWRRSACATSRATRGPPRSPACSARRRHVRARDRRRRGRL